MRKALAVLVFAVFALGVTPAWAFMGQGQPYVGFHVGGTFVRDAGNDARGGVLGSPLRIDTEYNTGFNIGGAYGYNFGLMRVEGEITYRQNDVDTVRALGFSSGAGGDVGALSFMGNGYIDLPTGTSFQPYVGGGIGFAYLSFNDVGFTLAGIPPFTIDDSDFVFAYQLGGGLAYGLGPFMALDLGYRYFATSDPTFRDAGVRVDSEYRTHNISLGLRIGF